MLVPARVGALVPENTHNNGPLTIATKGDAL